MVLPFERKYREQYYRLLDEMFDSGFWSQGQLTKTFEQKFSEFTGIQSVAISNAGAGLLAILDYVDVRDKEVILPTNTFWATALAVKKSGGNPVYSDCNKEDLCISLADIKRKLTGKTKAVIVVHIGGHIAFEIEEIADFCKENDLVLIEDCAHAHGGSYKGRQAGSWGLAGSYSFYATKTMPTGEGGMVVSHDKKFIDWLTKYINYGKELVGGKVTYPVKNGFNYRMNEITAALGIVQLERLPTILQWKRQLAARYDEMFTDRIIFPKHMESGYYKYIVFNYDVKKEAGRVFAQSDLCHIIDDVNTDLPNSIWAANNQRCIPIYYGFEGHTLNNQDLEVFIYER